MKLVAWLHKDPSRRMTSMYLVIDTPEGITHSFQFTEDGIQEVKIEKGAETKPLMEVSGVLQGFTQGFLQAMVDLGAEEGIFPEASHRELVTAEAIAEERLEVIEYERAQFGSILDRVLKSGDI